MTKTTNKLILAILAIATAFCLALGIFTAIPAKADGQAVFGIEGAQVRIATDAESDDSGIRFVAQINKTAYDQIVSQANGKTVFFGIELSVGGKSPLSFCYTASNLAGLSGFEALEFASETAIDKFTASITYNEETLAKQLALNEKFNTAYDATLSNEENIQAFKDNGLLDKYLETAYKTEITAKAYYQVETTDAEKVYADENGIARSIYGVATKAFLDKEDETLFDENGNFALVGKYFASATVLEEAVTVNEYGAITGYDFDETDKVYCGTSSITVTNGKIDKALVSALQDGDVLTLNVIKADGSLITLNANFDMLAEVISTEAIYDATAQKIYYETAEGVQIVDATNAFLVEDGTEFELVKNQYLFNKKDAVQFGTGNYFYDDVVAINADLTVKDGDGTALKEVAIPYSVTKADYTGVAMNIKNADGDILYSLSDVVLATAVIDDGAELKDTFNKADIIATHRQVGVLGNITKGVYMLADDIDAEATGFTYSNSFWNFFDGLLDGRGHNIKNLDVSGTKEFDNTTYVDAPSNGLFSAISSGSAIQNIAFIDVVANNGAVFQGNLGEVNQYYQNTYSMHWAYNYEGVSGDNTGRGYPEYRGQLGIPESDTTTLITEYLSSPYRAGNGNGGAVYSNVYVKVAPSTTQFRGVIARNMPNCANNVRGYNLVIEYLPKDASAYANQTESGYGVLFGGAYTYANNVAESSWNVEKKAKVWYEPTGNNEDGTTNTGVTVGPLNYVNSSFRLNGENTRIYVISTIGLVSSVKGAILGTNEEVSDSNPYKFITQKHFGNGDKGALERYDSYEELSALKKAIAALHSYRYVTTSTDKYWNYSNNTLVWKNLPAETPVA